MWMMAVRAPHPAGRFAFEPLGHAYQEVAAPLTVMLIPRYGIPVSGVERSP